MSEEDQRPYGVSLDDFYAYMPSHSYIFVPTREHWPAASVNVRIPPIPVLLPDGSQAYDDETGKAKKIKASTWLDQNRSVEQMTWAPGEGVVIEGRLMNEGGWVEREGTQTFNLYRPPSIEGGDPQRAGPWVDHLAHVYPSDANHIIDWLAHRVQHPEIKCNHALVLGGEQGIGKDSILAPALKAVGPWNVQDVSPTQLMGRFNGYVKSVILRISEAHDLGDVSRYQFYDRTKTYIAAPPDFLRCDEKNVKEHGVPNVCGVVITTNHKSDGIYLPSDDRRHYVAWSTLKRENLNEKYWQRLWRWYQEKDGFKHVAAFLAMRTLTTFNPHAPPPKTAAFWDIVNSNRAPEDAELADALDRLRERYGSEPDVVTIEDVVSASSPEFAAWLKDRRSSKAINHRMETAGYSRVVNDTAKDGQFKIGSKRVAVYGRASLPIRERLAAARLLAQPPLGVVGRPPSSGPQTSL